jgi:hypothetical protein
MRATEVVMLYLGPGRFAVTGPDAKWCRSGHLRRRIKRSMKMRRKTSRRKLRKQKRRSVKKEEEEME